MLFFSGEVSPASTLCACVTAHGSTFFCLHNWKCDVAASPLLHGEKIKLIADSHGDFAHPFQSPGNNCGSVSAPVFPAPRLPALRPRGGDCAPPHRDALCLRRRLTHSRDGAAVQGGVNATRPGADHTLRGIFHWFPPANYWLKTKNKQTKQL